MRGSDLPTHGTDHTSPTLLQRMRDEDAEAWERFVRLYAPLIQYWCAKRGLRDEDARDVTQTVLGVVSQKLHTFDRARQGSTFRGWLRVITRNKIIDHCRTSDRLPPAAGGTAAEKRLLQLPAQEGAEVADDKTELHGLYRRAVDLMKTNFEDRTWKAFWMSVVEERPTAEVCQALGIKPGSVRMARHRVLRLLRDQMGELLE